MTRYLLGSVLVAAAVLALVMAQQPGGVDEIRARAAQDLASQAAYASAPGGTPEDRAWEVLILMGAGDKAPADWSGSLTASAGDVFEIHGYRTELPDRILPQGGWQIQTKIEKVLESSPIEGGGQPESLLLPKGVLVRGSGTAATRVDVRTKQGECSFSPMRVNFGAPEKCIGGRIEVTRVPAETDLSGTRERQHDFPSIGAGPEGTLWATWQSFHDRREELNFRRYQNGKWTRLIPVGRATEDLWRPQVVTDGANKPWLIWSEQEKGNWDIYAMAWEDNEWGPRVRLSDSPTPDIEPHVARGADGVIYVVWQALEGRWSHIRMRYLKDAKWSAPVAVTSGEADDWEPAVAVGPNGTAHIVWDRYNESYDVFTCSFSPAARLSTERVVAGSKDFEADASVAVDSRNRAWIAYEVSGANWGKDLGAALGDKSPGSPLGGPRYIHVEGVAPLRFSDALGVGTNSQSDPLLFVDSNDNLWLSFKRRYSRAAYRPSTYWETYLTRLDGDHWTTPIPLPHSWARKSTRMGLATTGGRLWAFWPSESRNWAFASRPLANRVIAGSLPLLGKGTEPKDAMPAFSDLRRFGEAELAASAKSTREQADVSRIRAHRITVAGQQQRIVRGDLHRHTELSQDVGGLDDGSLPEFYRYMIDAANMDFGASTDHQAGGTDYWAFMTQKMADMYHFPQRFVPLYAYERNLGNPFGHRNIVHTQRDYPIVPFYQRIDPRFMLPDSPDGELLTFNSMSFGSGVKHDTYLLYESLRKTGGLAIPHTSASDNMGTDWSDKSDPKLEPVLEIYQGARYSSEAKNVPRGVRDGEEKKALGGFQEAGLVWNAWKKGYRLGVIASSDHYSTHISYALVYTPAATRQAIFDSILKRHTYGATDNIILEFWLGDHFMGDDFTAAQNQTIRVKAHGTGEIATVHLIRDAAYIYKWSPGKRDVDFEYRDNAAGPGEHWYYVRVEQSNGELAWSSPIWVRYR